MNTIIFDFDGTIADSFETILAVSHRLAQEFGLKPITSEDVKEFQNLSPREIIRRANIPIYKLPYFLRRLQVEMNHDISQIKPFPGIREALLQLHATGYALGIVTSNSHDNVSFFIKQHHLIELFQFVRTGVTLFGKARVINQLLKEYPVPRESIIYVGDETRDVEAARKTQIKVIAVGWGFNSGQALAEVQPDLLVQKPEELVRAIAQLAG
ncbi:MULTISPECIES: HAD hydrolase-like protein [unclassified Leptolyngbya]|uniref:HAD hydrolase-like protein n=1 Tax=unclassified Leptolyngbya TaxID=2650499 RepID=UPI001687D164|nr:HAD hydrolase-like protein [Leptolyngbya sp. FACHB-8]MBD2155491.1 HAD hydrolase-like protein [Leptolyngbya sp. FACHB-16]